MYIYIYVHIYMHSHLSAPHFLPSLPSFLPSPCSTFPYTCGLSIAGAWLLTPVHNESAHSTFVTQSSFEMPSIVNILPGATTRHAISPSLNGRRSFSQALKHGQWIPSTSSQYAAEGGWTWDAPQTPGWEPHFDEAAFCSRLPSGDLLVVGDSISSQSFIALFDLTMNNTAAYGSKWSKGWGDDSKGRHHFPSFLLPVPFFYDPPPPLPSRGHRLCNLQ